MKRPAHAENTLERIRRWRETCPDLTLRSTFIVGFPGETEDDFQALLDWLAEAQLDRVGCFKYSPVEGAAANALPIRCRMMSSRSAMSASWNWRARSARRNWPRRSADRCACWWIPSTSTAPLPLSGRRAGDRRHGADPPAGRLKAVTGRTS